MANKKNYDLGRLEIEFRDLLQKKLEEKFENKVDEMIENLKNDLLWQKTEIIGQMMAIITSNPSLNDMGITLNIKFDAVGPKT